jgi:hypothetical protein
MKYSCHFLFTHPGTSELNYKFFLVKSKSKSHCDWRSVGQSVSQSVSQSVLVSSPIWGPWPDIYFCLTVTFLFPWGALSDERTGLSFVCAAGPCQRSLSRALVPWDLRPYFTVSDLRLPISSPSTTRRVTVEVFDPASTWVILLSCKRTRYIAAERTAQKTHFYCCVAQTTQKTSN